MLSRTAVHGPAEDAWLMIVDITSAKFIDLFHPHHLIYAPLARIWWQIWEPFGIKDAYVTVQTLNCLIGAAAIWQLFILGRELKLSKWTAGWVATATGLSFAVWWLSSEIETAVLALLVGLILVRYLQRMRKRGLTMGGVIAAAGLTILAVATHVFHFSLVLLAIYVLLKPQADDSVDQRTVAGMNFNSGFVYLGLYLLVFVVGTFFLYWFVDYITASEMGPIGYLIGYIKPDGALHLSLMAPFLFGIGLVRSLFGVEILFHIPAVSGTVTRLFPAKDFTDETFMVSEINLGFVYVLGFMMLLAGMILLITIILNIRKITQLKEDVKGDVNFILIGLIAAILPVILSGPILYSSTANNEHLLLCWALFFLCLALTFERSGGLGKRVKINAIMLLVLLFVVNGCGTIYAMRNPENDLNIVTFTQMKGKVSPGDLLIVHLTERDAAALSYLTGTITINTMHEDYPSDDFLQRWETEHQGRVWIQQNIAPDEVKYPTVIGFKLERLKSE